MTIHNPGRIFWLGVALAEAIAPGTGRHRVNHEMKELHGEVVSLRGAVSELTTQNRYLRHELAVAEGEKNAFLAQDEMNAALSVEPVEEPYLLFGSNSISTLPMHMLQGALAKGSMSMPTGSENPAAIPVS
jgi:hypothetical protein